MFRRLGKSVPAIAPNWITGIILFVIAQTSAFGQNSSSEALTLEINEPSLVIDSAPNSVTINLTFRNHSDHDLVVYGLTGDLQAAPMALSDLCRADVGTGMAMALYHNDGTQEMPTVNMAAYSRVKGQKLPDSIRRAGEAEFIKSRIIIAKGAERSFVKELNLGDFYVEKGSYELEIVYYCGEKISSVVNVKKQNKGKAFLFQGCALSKRVRLEIR